MKIFKAEKIVALLKILARRSFVSFPAYLWITLFLLLLTPLGAMGHESWILTPEEMVNWNSRPKPAIFTEFNAVNISMYVFTAFFLVGWILLNYTGARELFPDLQVRLASYGGYSALALRIALFVMLGMGAFALGPRHGTELFDAPTLAAPDLELRLVPGN